LIMLQDQPQVSCFLVKGTERTMQNIDSFYIEKALDQGLKCCYKQKALDQGFSNGGPSMCFVHHTVESSSYLNCKFTFKCK
jgi:hypothetical protein